MREAAGVGGAGPVASEQAAARATATGPPASVAQVVVRLGGAVGNTRRRRRADDGLASPYCPTSGVGYSGTPMQGKYDFTGDGIPDLIMTSLTTPTSQLANLVLCKGAGDGTFRGAPLVTPDALPAAPVLVSAVDLDGDGINDIVAEANWGSGELMMSLSYVRGQPSGIFGQASAPTIISYLPTASSVVGDFKNVGHPQAVIPAWSTTSAFAHEVHWLILSGSGPVSAGDPAAILHTIDVDSGLSAGAGTASVNAVGDVNNDHNLDLIGTVSYINVPGPGYTRVVVSLGNGSGGFTSTTVIAGTDGASVVTVTDVNGDGNLDLQVFTLSQSAPMTFYGDGTGNFSSTTP